MFYFLTWVPVFMILIHYGSAIVNVLSNIQKLLEDKKDEEETEGRLYDKDHKL